MTNTTDTTLKHYAVVNTVGPFWVMDSLTTDADEAKRRAAEMNSAFKPEYQTFTVATVTFDPEI